MSTHHPLSNTEQQIASARGMHEAMRHQRDKAQAGLDAAQAEIRRLRELDRAKTEMATSIIRGLSEDDECWSDTGLACLAHGLQWMVGRKCPNGVALDFLALIEQEAKA